MPTFGTPTKLFPTVDDVRVGSFVGRRVALSGDGRTAFLGTYVDPVASGPFGDNAVYVFVLESGTWILQETLTGSGRFGWAIAASYDGDTVAVSDNPFDTTGTGTVTVYVRAAGSWSEQTSFSGAAHTLNTGFPVSTSAVLGGWFGSSIDLSADGNTLAVGYPGQPRSMGSWRFTNPVPPATPGFWTLGEELGLYGGFVYVFERDEDGAWSGPDAVSPTDASAWIPVDFDSVYDEGSSIAAEFVRGASFGASVSLSDDGTILAISGPGDTNFIGAGPGGAPTGADFVHDGAFWTFVKSGGSWTQAGDRVPAPTGPVGMSLSGNGAILFTFTVTGSGPDNIIVYSVDETGAVSEGQHLNTLAEINRTLNGVPLSQDGAVGAGSIENNFVPPETEDPVGTRHDDAWLFQNDGAGYGFELVPLPDDIDGTAGFGYAAAVSSNGRTLLIGGPGDNDFAGAAWIYGPGGLSVSFGAVYPRT